MDPQLQPQSDLQKANEILYQQNFELSIKNQTLSTLRKLYDISLSTFNTQMVCQKIVDAIYSEFGFSAAMISLIDTDTKSLKPVAINTSTEMQTAVESTGKKLTDISIPLNFDNNLAITCIRSKSRQITTNLLDILDPVVTQEVADRIENTANVKTVIIYPLLLAGEPIGVLNIGLPKKADDLSKAERETLEQLIDLITLAIDRTKLYQDLQDANLQLKQLSKVKDEFVYLASHELRTPLTAIKSYSWMSLNGKGEPLGPKNQKNLEVVYNSTERLIHLVNEMLDLSRIESGKVQLQTSVFTLSELLEQLKQEFSARAVEKDLSLTYYCPSDIKITADRDKLLQIFENLVGNSFKFTPPGGQVNILVKNNNKMLEIGVSDTGKGINAEDIPKLFSKFGRLDNSLVTTPESGTGLGLYITKQYVEMHGGTISVDSVPGQGTTFTFTLPV